MELVRCKSRPCGRKRKVAVPADGGGKRGEGLSKRNDRAEVPAVVVIINAHPPRTPHDHMDSINRTFDDEQLDVSIDSLAKNVVFFPLYYKLVLKIYKNIDTPPAAHLYLQSRRD